MSTPRRLLSLALVATLGLAACTAAATPVPTAAPTAPGTTPTTDGTLPKPELATVKLGTPIGEVSQFNSVLADSLGLNAGVLAHAVASDDQELLATPAHDVVAASADLAQPLAHLDQHGVAG